MKIAWLPPALTEFKIKTKNHDELIKAYTKEAEDKRHFILPNAFHDYLPEQIQKLLINPEMTKFPTIAYLRAMPDLVDITAKDSYYVDCKTLDAYRPPAKNSTIPNLAIEVMSFATDYLLAGGGVRTLIPVRYPAPYNMDKGFWLEPFSRALYCPSCVFVPPESKDTEKEKMHMAFARYAFGENIAKVQLTNGNCKSDSGDLFILQPANTVLQMQDWRSLITDNRK